MKSLAEVEKLVKRFRIKPTVKMREKTLTDALKAQEEIKKTESTEIQPNIWRIIMKTKITKFAAAAVIIIAVLLGLEFIGGPSTASIAFAEVVQQIRKARTVTFTTEIKVGEQTMRFENASKEPGLKRTVMPGGLVVIADLIQRKTIFINHSEKQYTEKGLENVPADQTQDFFEYMKTLPDRANEVLEKKEMDGRMVQGFRVTKNDIDSTFWIDVQTGDLVRVEGQLPNAPKTRIVGTNFKFDVELDDALFSLIPPDGYAPKEPPKIDRSEVNCQDLINLLRWWATNTEGHFFPPSLEPAEFRKAGMEMKKAGKIPEIQGTKDEKMQHMMKLTRGLQFVMMMKPENDWHYVGNGVELGDADTAICWYRPQGSQTYRVIYGDLSFAKDVASENLPK